MTTEMWAPSPHPEEGSLFTEVWSADLQAHGPRWTVTTHTVAGGPGSWVPFGIESGEEVAPGFHTQGVQIVGR